MLSNPSDILASVEREGYWLTTDVSPQDAEEIVDGLGKLLFITDVKVKPGRALVTSDRELGFHTDHHLADFICWYCIEQTDQGGETLLLDAYEVLKRLPQGEEAILKQIQLHEHKVFKNDPKRFPLLSERLGRPKIYYSYWMLRDDATEQKRAFNAFRSLTEQAAPIRLKLKPRDVLVIDNGRMLHGRSAIEGNKRRFLKRFWIARTDQKEGKPHAATGIASPDLAGASRLA